MFSHFQFRLLFLILLLLFSRNGKNSNVDCDALQKHQREEFSLGAIVDYSSRAGKEEKVAMEMAIDDFFPLVSHRPALHVKNSRGDPVQAASSVKTLVKKHHARVILGLGTWQEAASVAEFANKTDVPILSLANDVPSWAGTHWPFLVSAARNQITQTKAVADIIRSWQCRRVNIIYEDINSTTTVAYLMDALREAKSEIHELLPLSPFPQYKSLSENLKSLKNGPCRVSIVHTSLTLATNIFREAKKLGMMEKDFVWITTNSITDVIHTLNETILASMEGVLGVKSYFSHSGKQFEDFRSRFRAKFFREYPKERYRKPGIFALQAYDSVRAVAVAVKENSDRKHFPNSADDAAEMGKKILNGILKCHFEGLTGTINFKRGMLVPAHVYRIVNVFNKNEIELGYWTDGLGFSMSIGERSTYSESMKILKQVPWPGASWTLPSGLEVVKKAKTLKIGVPAGNSHQDFVNVRYGGDEENISGFSIVVFRTIVKTFLSNELEYDFVPLNGSYNSLVEKIYHEDLDAVIGDTAILANRSRYAEFSQPYAEAGIQIVVYNKYTRAGGAWLYMKPFTIWMWVTTGAIVLYNGFVVWLIERKHNQEFTKGTKLNQVGFVVSLAFTTLFSLHGQKLHSNLSRMTMVVWLFVSLIITQSYTASLTSLLNQPPEPIIPTPEMLKRNGAIVGCDADSFVGGYLETVGFRPEKIRKIHSDDEYEQALKNGSIAAAFLEVPYVKVFLAKHCNAFSKGKITFPVGGFGFVFPMNSPHLPNISRAILQLSEKGILKELETSIISTYNCSSPENKVEEFGLGLPSFQGLFLMTAGTSTIAIVLFVIPYFYTRRGCSLHINEQPNTDANESQLLLKSNVDEESLTRNYQLSDWDKENLSPRTVTVF